MTALLFRRFFLEDLGQVLPIALLVPNKTVLLHVAAAVEGDLAQDRMEYVGAQGFGHFL
jgi:hypothetical protein